jgi:hypothetical protein
VNRFVRYAAVAVAALGPIVATSVAVAAPEDKPAAVVNTKTIEATLTIDPKLKAWPGLHDNLLAEGRREITKWRAESEKRRKEMPDLFQGGRRYTFERAYSERSAIGRYVSVMRADDLDGLGAHPDHQINMILWDAQAKKRVSIRPFFKESATGGPTLDRLAQLIRLKLAAQKRQRDIAIDDPDTDSDLSRVEPDLLKMGAVALVPSAEKNKSAGLVFYFSPYLVGSYAEGEYTAYVSWTDFKSELSPEGLALFGGERAAGDEKND